MSRRCLNRQRVNSSACFYICCTGFKVVPKGWHTVIYLCVFTQQTIVSLTDLSLVFFHLCSLSLLFFFFFYPLLDCLFLFFSPSKISLYLFQFVCSGLVVEFVDQRKRSINVLPASHTPAGEWFFFVFR